MIITRNMNAPFKADSLSLDELKVGTCARVTSIDWDLLEHSEACRLRHFGFDEGVLIYADPDVFREEWVLMSLVLPTETCQIRGEDLVKVFAQVGNPFELVTDFNQAG